MPWGNSEKLFVLMFAIVFIIALLFCIVHTCSFEYSIHITTHNASSSSSSSPPLSHRHHHPHALSSPSLTPSTSSPTSSPTLSPTITVFYHQTPTEMNENQQHGECSICLEGFKQGEKVKMLLSCCHSYHCDCIDKWLITNSTCPICRTSIPLDSPV